MDKGQVKRIFDFLEEKGEHRAPFLWKFKNNEPLIEEDLNVKGNLNLFQSNITSLPEGLKVEGNLDLYHCKHLTSLPKGLKVGSYLWLAETNITSLPEGLEVGSSLDLSFSKITSLPKGLVVNGDLDLTGTSLADDYNQDELREMVYPGFIHGEILI
jgi:hypothetical protein